MGTAFTQADKDSGQDNTGGMLLCDCDNGCDLALHRTSTGWQIPSDQTMHATGLPQLPLCVVKQTSSDGCGDEVLAGCPEDFAELLFAGCVQNNIDENGYWWAEQNSKCVEVSEKLVDT